MIENINLKAFKKAPAVYYFESNNEIIYVGSSKNLYNRLHQHRSCIKKGGDHNGTSKQDLYQFLQSNQFTIHFAYTDDYKKMEQQLINQHNPKYNCLRAYTGLGAKIGREAEYNKEYHQKYKEELSKQQKQYRESHKEEISKHQKQYYSRLCLYNGETLTLKALRCRFKRKGISNPTQEAKKYLIEVINEARSN